MDGYDSISKHFLRAPADRLSGCCITYLDTNGFAYPCGCAVCIVQLESSIAQCGQYVCTNHTVSNEARKKDEIIEFFPFFLFCLSFCDSPAQCSNFSVLVSYDIMNEKGLIPCIERIWVVYIDVVNYTTIITPAEETSCFKWSHFLKRISADSVIPHEWMVVLCRGMTIACCSVKLH